MNIGTHVRIGNGDIAWIIVETFTSPAGCEMARLKSGNSERTRIEHVKYLSPWRRNEGGAS